MRQKLQNLNSQQKAFIYYAALFCVVWILFGNTLMHEYNLDDSYYINLLPEKGAEFGATFDVFTKWFGKSNYRPLPAFHLAVEQFIFGQSPTVFHFFNLFYYSLLGVLLFFVFKKLKLFDKQWPIFLMVLFFLIHPSHSNVVSSIKNRDVILSMLYGMLFIWAILKFQEERKIYYIPICIFFIVASVACKIDGVLFVALAGVLLYFLRAVKIKKILVPLFAIMGIAIGLYVFSTMFFLSEPEVKATTDFWENPMVQVNFFIGTILNTGLTMNYHKFMVIPKDYFFYYGFNQVNIPPLLSFQILGAFVAHLLIFLAAIYHLYKGRRNKIMMGVIIYFMFLIPFVVLMHTVAGIIAVRYSFNASLGFSIVVIGLYYLAYQKSNKFLKPIMAVLLSSVFIIFSYATFQRNKDWKNKETLFVKDLKKLDKSYMANRMAGIYFFNISKLPTTNEATKKEYLKYSEKYLNAAKNILPQDPVLWLKLGELNVSRENYKEAYFNYKEAIAVDSTNIAAWEAYGEFCILAKDYKRTEDAFRQILLLDDDNINAYRNFLNALVKQGKVEEAISIAEGMIQYPKIEMEGLEFLGNIYWELGDTLKSVGYFQRSVEKGNTDTRINDFIDYYNSSNN